MHVSITGLGRGGTSIMGHVFSTHPRVEFRHEQSGPFLASNFGIAWMGRTPPEQATEKHAARAQAWAMPKDKGKLLVEKDPTHVHRMAYMRKLWPEAKFIYMVRDPRDLTSSALNGLRKKGKTADQWMNERGRVAKSLRWLSPRQRLVAWWQHVLLYDLRDMQLDDAFLVVKYEDLLASPLGTVAPLFDWVGLDRHPRVEQFLEKVTDDPNVHVSHFSSGNFVRGHARRVGRWRDEWPEDDARGAWRIAGDTMAALGYTED